eukprot:m.195797 g.195797  ORF g.195797 m.195797 type:complete len:52 (-) comp13671_c1_seq1:79-234(-)
MFISYATAPSNKHSLSALFCSVLLSARFQQLFIDGTLSGLSFSTHCVKNNQ